MEPVVPPASAPSTPRRRPSVTLRFRVPFPTRWGENLVLCGDDDRLGGWEPARGAWMQCLHVGDLLVWQVQPARVRSVAGGSAADAAFAQALVSVQGLSSFRYRYVVVDEQARRGTACTAALRGRACACESAPAGLSVASSARACEHTRVAPHVPRRPAALLTRLVRVAAVTAGRAAPGVALARPAPSARPPRRRGGGRLRRLAGALLF